jgi:methylenetetrahydrofolate dehydrogenase (NADP+) / methenyltetrahydrofolate cyclohydrolase
MTATLIDGKAVAARLRQALAVRVAALGFAPGLRVVRVGEDPA